MFGKWFTYLVNGKQIRENSAAQLFGKIQHSCLAKFSTVVWQNSAQLFGRIQQFQSW